MFCVKNAILYYIPLNSQLKVRLTKKLSYRIFHPYKIHAWISYWHYPKGGGEYL